MKLLEAEKVAKEKMAEHGLIETGWSFGFDRAKRRFGVTKFKTKQITLSTSLTELNSEKEVIDTILHEIAHALVGPRHGHNRVWQYKAVSIGCSGRRCAGSDTVQAPAKYISTCPGCGKVGKGHKRTQSACGKCCREHNRGKYTDEFKLIWTEA